MKLKNPLPLIIAIICVLLLTIVLAAVYAFFGGSDQPTAQTTEKARPPKNEYRDEGFFFEDGFMHYQDTPHLKGIDVSVHQGVIDWQAVADSGVDYAIIRAGYRGSTIGDLYEDEQFRYNIEGARSAGLKLGIYFFSQALTTEEAVEEAKFVCDLLGDIEPDLPIYYDWEYIGGRVSRISDVPLTECAIAFCEEVKSQGYRAGVYFNQEFGYYYLDLTKLQEYHLWLAEYNEIPTFRYHFDCLQFTDSGRIPGIETEVDLNILFLTE